jgi:hypothetical protein
MLIIREPKRALETATLNEGKGTPVSELLLDSPTSLPYLEPTTSPQTSILTRMKPWKVS